MVYQQAVEFLTKNPNYISQAWSEPFSPGGCLFHLVSTSRVSIKYGCLTQIKAGYAESSSYELTKSIRNDKRLPMSWSGIYYNPDTLFVFAQWQRFIDFKLRREPLAMDTRIPLPTQEVDFTLEPVCI